MNLTHKKQTGKYKILLVDDDPINLRSVVWMLQNSGIMADISENGVDAVERVKRGPYDLIIMDIEMPEMDGYEATRAIRQWEAEESRINSIPIVAVSAHSIESIEEKCLSAGMNGCITKPVKVRELNMLLTVYLYQSQKSNKGQRVAQNFQQKPKTSSPFTDIVNRREGSVFFDEQELKNRAGGNEKLYAQILEMFFLFVIILCVLKTLNGALKENDRHC